MTVELFSRFGRTFSKGDVLFRRGDPATEMYVLHEGSVRIVRQPNNRTVAVMRAGDVFGELSMLNGRPRSADAIAEEDGSCIAVDQGQLEVMILARPEIARRLLSTLAGRLQSASDLIDVLLQKDPRARVVMGLSHQARANGVAFEDGISVPISGADLAKIVDLDESTVQDLLEQMSEMRLIDLAADGHIRMADMDGLTDFADFLETPDHGA
jgi:CRP/FNR family transcriptional regulator, cyclic AMP receptor protein